MEVFGSMAETLVSYPVASSVLYGELVAERVIQVDDEFGVMSNCHDSSQAIASHYSILIM